MKREGTLWKTKVRLHRKTSLPQSSLRREPCALGMPFLVSHLGCKLTHRIATLCKSRKLASGMTTFSNLTEVNDDIENSNDGNSMENKSDSAEYDLSRVCSSKTLIRGVFLKNEK